MRVTLRLLVALVFPAAVAACPPAGGEGEGEGEIEIVDSGVPAGEGEGEGEVGEGEGEGEAGEGEGEGETVQGTEYTTGVAEPGVVCGAMTCALATDSCCVGLVPGTPPLCAPAGTCTPFSTVEVPCDGAEDCAATAECCRVGFALSCVEGGCLAAGGDKICVNTAECGVDNTCCSSDLLATAGVDGGICQPTVNNCSATLPSGGP